MNLNKVYCEDCKYFLYNDMLDCSKCSKILNYKDSPICKVPIYGKSKINNKHNNCRFYEESLSFKLIGYIMEKIRFIRIKEVLCKIGFLIALSIFLINYFWR